MIINSSVKKTKGKNKGEYYYNTICFVLFSSNEFDMSNCCLYYVSLPLNSNS